LAQIEETTGVTNVVVDVDVLVSILPRGGGCGRIVVEKKGKKRRRDERRT